jgi:hypothetical protein
VRRDRALVEAQNGSAQMESVSNGWLATRSIELIGVPGYEDEPLCINAGEWLAPDHAAVAAEPDAFKPDPRVVRQPEDLVCRLLELADGFFETHPRQEEIRRCVADGWRLGPAFEGHELSLFVYDPSDSSQRIVLGSLKHRRVI